MTSRGARQTGGMVLGVAIALAIGAVFVFGMKSVGTSLNRSWTETTSYPAVDQPPSTRPNAASTYNELRTACLAQSKTVDLSRAMRDDLEYFRDIRIGERQLEQHAAFIDCLITEHPGRLCQAEHRTHLTDAVRTYFLLRARVREEWTLAMRSPFSASSKGLVARPGRQGISTPYPSERADPRIVDGLKSLIREGYITRADLGDGFMSRMPGDLGEQLQEVERMVRTCG